jgi:hypothetical protein
MTIPADREAGHGEEGSADARASLSVSLPIDLKRVPRPADAARSFVSYRAQVQAFPHWQIAPQRHPGLRVSVFFLDIGSSFCEADPTSVFTVITHSLRIHYTFQRPVYCP